MKRVRVAAVQFEHAAGDKAANLSKIRGFVETAAAGAAEIVVFPECCITGYWWLRKLTRPELYGPLTVRTGIEQDTRVLRMGSPADK